MECKSCGKEITRLKLGYYIIKYKKLSTDGKRLEDCYQQEFKKEGDNHEYQWTIGHETYFCPNPDCMYEWLPRKPNPTRKLRNKKRFYLP